MRSRFCLLLAAVVALGCGTAVCQSTLANSVPATAVLHDGCPIQFSLGRTVSSESDQPGELVEFVVKQDVMAGDIVVIPSGSSVYGRVIASRMDDRSGKGGMLEFRLESLKLANGQEIPLRTVRNLPSDANADLRIEKITNLVNSPYAPFAHFNNGYVTTVPKNVPVTLFVAADVRVGNQPFSASPFPTNQADNLASHIMNTNGGAKSLGQIAREQREHGKISGGMVARQP